MYRNTVYTSSVTEIIILAKLKFANSLGVLFAPLPSVRINSATRLSCALYLETLGIYSS